MNADTSHNKAVLYTLDGLLMTVILISALLVAYSLAPSPGAVEDSTDEVRFETEAQSLVDIAEEKGAVQNALLYWDDSQGQWADATDGDRYAQLPSSHPLQTYLQRLNDRGYAYQINLKYFTPRGEQERKTVVSQGVPTADATVVDRTITVNDDTNLVGPSSGQTLKSAGSYPAPDAFDGRTYNTLTIEVIIWFP